MTEEGRFLQLPIPQEIRQQEELRLCALSQEVATLAEKFYDDALKRGRKFARGNIVKNDQITVDFFGVGENGKATISIVEQQSIYGEGEGSIYFAIKAVGNNVLCLDVATDERQRRTIEEMRIEDPENINPVNIRTRYKFMPNGTIKKEVEAEGWDSEVADYSDDAAPIESISEYTVIGLALQRIRDKLKDVVADVPQTP